jgi:hypothetical protein
MLRPRAASRASVLMSHVQQLDSAVNLRDYPDRLPPDSDRHSPGVRVIAGPETRSLLRQLLASRDLRTQQQLVREIRHQVQKRVLAALRRARAMERARERLGKVARGARHHGGRLLGWLRSAAGRARGARETRTVGNRKPVTRARTGGQARTREPVARTRKPAERATRARTARQ